MSRPASIVVVDANDRYQIGYSGSLVIAAWVGRAQPADLDVFRRAELEALEHVPALNLVIALKLLGGGIEPEMRARGEALQREFADRLVGQAIVLAGTGLLAATIRAFAGGLNLLSRGRVATRTFGVPDEALGWLAGLHGQTPEDAEHLGRLGPAVGELTRPLYAE